MGYSTMLYFTSIYKLPT